VGGRGQLFGSDPPGGCSAREAGRDRPSRSRPCEREYCEYRVDRTVFLPLSLLSMPGSSGAPPSPGRGGAGTIEKPTRFQPWAGESSGVWGPARRQALGHLFWLYLWPIRRCFILTRRLTVNQEQALPPSANRSPPGNRFFPPRGPHWSRGIFRCGLADVNRYFPWIKSTGEDLPGRVQGPG